VDTTRISPIDTYFIFPKTEGRSRIFSIHGVDRWGTPITYEGMTVAYWPPTNRAMTADEVTAIGKAWAAAASICSRLQGNLSARRNLHIEVS
jgi:hypothetical protein